MNTLSSNKDPLLVSYDRPDGLSLKIIWKNSAVHSDLSLDKRFNGETGTISSGILFRMMDVLMGSAILVSTGKFCVAHIFNAAFIKPVEPYVPNRVSGRFVRIDGKNVFAMAEVRDASGNMCWMADAIFRENKELPLSQALKSFDFTNASPRVREFFESLLSHDCNQTWPSA